MRGKIRNRDFNQQVDFSGLIWNKITPTDIDGFVEFGDKLYIFIELKYGDAVCPRGQALALERVCNRIQSSGVPCYVILAKHNTPQNSDIVASNSIVSKVYYCGKWYTPDELITLAQIIERLRTRFNI